MDFCVQPEARSASSCARERNLGSEHASDDHNTVLDALEGSSTDSLDFRRVLCGRLYAKCVTNVGKLFQPSVHSFLRSFEDIHMQKTCESIILPSGTSIFPDAASPQKRSHQSTELCSVCS